MSIGKNIDEGVNILKKLAKGEQILHSNAPINKITNFTGGLEVVGKVFNGDEVGKAIKSTFKNGDKWNVGKIAGSAIGASAVGRIASGGGIYRDKDGNTNIIGVPFV